MKNVIVISNNPNSNSKIVLLITVQLPLKSFIYNIYSTVNFYYMKIIIEYFFL